MNAFLTLASAYLAIGWVLSCVLSIGWPRAAWVTLAWLPILLVCWARELIAPFKKEVR